MMSEDQRKESLARLKTKDKPGVANKGKYVSIEEAPLAKMESAKEFIANLDMALFKKNGHIE